jgi:large subunit ribosomal protein L24
MNKMHVKKGDSVTVISGDSKGKTGKVLRVMPALGLVLVEGVNIVKRHQRALKEGTKGQIVDKHLAINASKVRLSDKKKKAAK